ncbi:hypothetical protein HII31_02966 [Pseudocercospora fuligena]|uniref:Uncharacterized protein n=1 Tax=Pseudocercospora fuligena TaxID=685502 RepID=A0A8H6RQR9_9PEZI|nr:hypothetical protein HII31_02966 [Pseudocercospora fuligena]
MHGCCYGADWFVQIRRTSLKPPFTHFWYTRSFYELGSGRAPFVTHVDYDPQKQKSEQRYAKFRPAGVTLGDLVDAVCELFERYEQTKFVMVESVRTPNGEQASLPLSEDRPTTRSYIPGMSAERAHGWHREL